MQTVVVKESRRAKTRNAPDSTHTSHQGPIKRLMYPHGLRISLRSKRLIPPPSLASDCSVVQLLQDYYFQFSLFSVQHRAGPDGLRGPHFTCFDCFQEELQVWTALRRCYNWDCLCKQCKYLHCSAPHRSVFS